MFREDPLARRSTAEVDRSTAAGPPPPWTLPSESPLYASSPSIEWWSLTMSTGLLARGQPTAALSACPWCAYDRPPLPPDWFEYRPPVGAAAGRPIGGSTARNWNDVEDVVCGDGGGAFKVATRR